MIAHARPRPGRAPERMPAYVRRALEAFRLLYPGVSFPFDAGHALGHDRVARDWARLLADERGAR